MTQIDPHAVLRLRQQLAEVFTDSEVARVLGASSMCEWLAKRKLGQITTAPLEEDSAVSALTAIWVLGKAVPSHLVISVLGDSVNFLRDAELLVAINEDCFESSVSILPCGEFWLITDHIRAQGAPDSVFFPDSSSVKLMSCLPKMDGPHLDIGTGCGLTALVAASTGREVHIHDVNLRAIGLTNLGFTLNALPPPYVCEGEFTSIEGFYNSITFNLPLPATTEWAAKDPVHTRADRDGLLELVLDWLPNHLAPQGIGLLHTRFPDKAQSFNRALEQRCYHAGWRGLALCTPDRGIGRFGLIAIQRSELRGFKYVEIASKDNVWNLSDWALRW